MSMHIVDAVTHPSLFLTPAGVRDIRNSLGKYPAFDNSYAELKAIADKALQEPVEVPVPKDGGGGYTHEKHKNNYYEMNAAGIVYQITGRVEYARFVRDMLMKYAALYPTLGLHPAVKSETPGRLFWQTLNDNVWLVHTAIAYDCVYNYMTEQDRACIEKNLFRPMAEFLSNGNAANYETFNKMHNHGTWATAAVGMIGYVMGDKDLVDKALYGSKKDGKSGFIRQLDVLFSPDGYFTEGPYYMRYSIWPFMTFAQAVQNNQPEKKIFRYRDGVLHKAVDVLLQCAYNGEFFYLNDALKKTYATQEVVYAVDIACLNNPADKALLDIVRGQKACLVSDAGLAAAKAADTQPYVPFVLHSALFRDGANGDEGGIAVYRNGSACLTLKATSHGLSHGHYDKLSLALFDNGNPVLTDYGAVRFLNIEPKNAGHYTKENFTWGMQTIAHNTVAVDGRSHFNADIKQSSLHHSDILYAGYADSSVQVIAAAENNAYKGVKMQRTSALIKADGATYPFVLDLFRVTSDSAHVYDLPFYYQGQMVMTDFAYKKNTTELKALGAANGYQHLWLEATGTTDKPTGCFTFVQGDRFYSITTLAGKGTEFMMTRIGAGDPDFNLRYDPCFMVRHSGSAGHTFVSMIEPHGLYDLNREVTENYETSVAKLEKLNDDDAFTAVGLTFKNGRQYVFITVNRDFDASKPRQLIIGGKSVKFNGNYCFEAVN
jgi:hypothetical protein